ncbi:MAG: glutathione S-transferase C-terminal domain-containing protein, partial [Acidimicrobiales bacterium]
EFICGNRPTLADLRMLAFLVRFDDVYYVHFKCSRRLIREMPNLSKYMSRMLQIPGISSTVSRSEIKEHYYKSHTLLNPGGLVPQTLTDELWLGGRIG